MNVTVAAAAAKSLQSCLTLCDPIDSSPPGSPVPGILQARTLEWVAISFSNAWKWKVKVKLLSKCPTLRDPMDCSLPGSSVHRIFQARVLEWGAIAFSASSLYLPHYVIRFSLFYPSLPPRLLSRPRIKPYLSYGFLCPKLDKTLNKGWKKMSEFQIQKFILDDKKYKNKT